jgi:hypothetical protein
MKKFPHKFRNLIAIPAVCATVVACGDNNGPINAASAVAPLTANTTVASIGSTNSSENANSTLSSKAAAIIGSWGARDQCVVGNGIDLPGGLQVAQSMNIVRLFESVNDNTIRVTATGTVYGNPGCYGTSTMLRDASFLLTIDSVSVVDGRTHVLYTDENGEKGFFAISADNSQVMEGKRTSLRGVYQTVHPTVVLEQSALHKNSPANLTPRPCAQEAAADTIKYCSGSDETTVVSPLANNSMSTGPDMARFWDGLTTYLRYYPNALRDETLMEFSVNGGANFYACSSGGNAQSLNQPSCSVGRYSRGSTLVPSTTRVMLQAAPATVLVLQGTTGLALYDASKYIAISSGLLQAPGF